MAAASPCLRVLFHFTNPVCSSVRLSVVISWMCASFYLVSTRMYLEMRDFKTKLNQKSPELEFRLGNGPEFHPLGMFSGKQPHSRRNENGMAFISGKHPKEI